MPLDSADEQGLYEEARPDSPHIQCIWQARAVRDERYLVPAVEYWDVWFARDTAGAVSAGLSGPSLGHRWIRSEVGEYSWGLQFQAHVALPGLNKQAVMGTELPLQVAGGRVQIMGHHVPLPDYGNLVAFADHLLALGVVHSDEDVRRALSGDDAGYSQRQWQRRVRGSTGLTRKQIAQLVRAREAFTLLQQGLSPAQCASECGYSDQAHLTRSLRMFHGLTPARILASGRTAEIFNPPDPSA